MIHIETGKCQIAPENGGGLVIDAGTQKELTEEEEKARLFTHWAGHAASLEEASSEARAKAGEFFGNGNDTLANFWRDVSKWLSEKAKKCRETQRGFR